MYYYDDIMILILCICMWLIAAFTLLMALSRSPIFIVLTIISGCIGALLIVGLRANSDILG